MSVQRGKIESDETPEDAAEWDRRIEAVVAKARLDPRFAHLFEAETEADIAASIERARRYGIGPVRTARAGHGMAANVGNTGFKPMPREWRE